MKLIAMDCLSFYPGWSLFKHCFNKRTQAISIINILAGTFKKLMSRVYLIGFMGVGKSTIGRQLATGLGYQFADMDDLFEQKYKLSIDHFFSKYDEELFRRLESDLLTTTFEYDNIVIATGGGTPCHHDGIKRMNDHGLTVYLEMPPDALVNRLRKAKKKRPLILNLPDDELSDSVQERLANRLAYYNQAQIAVDAMNIDIKKLSEQVKKLL
jgi:shikimate kinase